jgi:hypothetical protein
VKSRRIVDSLLGVAAVRQCVVLRRRMVVATWARHLEVESPALSLVLLVFDLGS